MFRTILTVTALATLISAQGRLQQFTTTNSPGAPFASGGYGANTTSMGDLDGDGFEDYATVAPGAAMPLGGLNNAGVVYVHSGRNRLLIQTMLGDQPGAMFGDSMLSVGDVNNDGVPDLAVGSPSHDFAFGNAGRVTMFSGATGGVLWTSDGEFQGVAHGTCLSATPDLTGDGVPDMVTGEPDYTITGIGRGRVVFLNGVTGTTFGTAEGLNLYGSFGATAAGTVTQLAVFIGDSVGRTFRVPAPIAGVSTPVLFRDKPPGGHVAAQLALIPKQGGGHRLAIGLSSADVNGNNSGVLWLHELSGFQVFERPGAIAIGSYGGVVARGHDLDGDGEDEILSARGQSPLMSAVVEIVRQNGTLQDSFESGCADGPRLWSLDDTTGDGRGELLVSYSSGLCGLAQVSLYAEGLELSTVQNGQGDTVVTTNVDMGAAQAGASYWQLFSISGTQPGFIGPAPWPLIPLNFDSMTELGESVAGSPMAPDSYGTLDGVGRATTVFTVPAFVSQALPGLPFQTCLLVLNGAGNSIVGTSNPGAWALP